MKIRSLTFVLGVVGALALVACKSETGTNVGGGGAGGSGGVGGQGGQGGGADCVDSCASAITDDQPVCSGGAGEATFTALQNCASGDTTCAGDCSNFVGTGIIDSACATCLQQGACSQQYTDCSNDI